MMPDNDQNRHDLMRQVMMTGFALDDITLYLDTHSDDPNAMEYYRSMQCANRDAVGAYEAAYGPLMINQVNSSAWGWTDSPWPWEGGR